MRTMDLSRYDNSWYDPGRRITVRALWLVLGLPLVRSRLPLPSSLRVAVLRLFGARLGDGVVIKPEVAIKYPWHLEVGDHCWIGEGAWIDNLTTVSLGASVCLSQGAYLCTGNHDWSDPAFGLRVAPIRIAEGAWVGARATLLPGTVMGQGAVAAAGSVVSGEIAAGEIYAGNPAQRVRRRELRSVPDSRARSATGPISHGPRPLGSTPRVRTHGGTGIVPARAEGPQ